MTMGGDQELIARLRTSSGSVWGVLGLYREPGRVMFDRSDKQFIQAISGHLADGARRALRWVRPQIRTARMDPGWSFSTAGGRSSPRLPESTGGSTNCPTAT